MADNDRWRNDPDRYSYRDGRRDWLREDSAYSRAGRGSEYRGGGYGAENYSRSYPDYARPDDGTRGPHQDVWGYRGERSGWNRASDEMASWFGDTDAERRRQQDARKGDRGAQHHRGRGPKGYTRSDQRILEDVSDRLTDDPHLDASEIAVSVNNQEVTLSGTVVSREDKRHAEDIAEAVPGVIHVQNNLRFQPAPSGSSTSQQKVRTSS